MGEKGDPPPGAMRRPLVERRAREDYAASYNAGGLWLVDRPRCPGGFLVAALVAGLAFVAELARRLSSAVATASALVAGLALVPLLARRLIGEDRARGAQSEQTGE
jgi:hypothetical protein